MPDACVAVRYTSCGSEAEPETECVDSDESVILFAGCAKASARASGAEKRARVPRIARVNVCRRRARLGKQPA